MYREKLRSVEKNIKTSSIHSKILNIMKETNIKQLVKRLQKEIKISNGSVEKNIKIPSIRSKISQYGEELRNYRNV